MTESVQIVKPTSATLQAFEKYMADPSTDVAKLEKLLEMHERILARDAEIQFNEAMRDVQMKVSRVVSDAQNDHTRSRYAKLEAIDRMARPIYTEHGFSLSFGTADSPKPDFIRVTCDALHAAGHDRHYFIDLPPDLAGARGNANKNAVQGHGSTVTYGQRYLVKLIFNIVITNDPDDDDGNGGDPSNELTPDQMKANIEQLIKDRRRDKTAVMAWLKTEHGIDDLGKLTPKVFNAAVTMIERAAKRDKLKAGKK